MPPSVGAGAVASYGAIDDVHDATGGSIVENAAAVLGRVVADSSVGDTHLTNVVHDCPTIVGHSVIAESAVSHDEFARVIRNASPTRNSAVTGY